MTLQGNVRHGGFWQPISIENTFLVQLTVRKFMMRQTVCRLLMLATLVLALLVPASSAFAQEDHETAREAGPVIRHQLLYRSTRFELAPMLGMTLNDAYVRNGIVGAQLSYHLTNNWGVSLVAGAGALQFDTDLRERLEDTVSATRPDELGDISYSYVQFVGGLEVSYVPIVGKFSLFNSAITNFDIHLIGGFGGVLEAAATAADNGQVDEQLEGFRPAPVLGIGTRFFMSDGISVNVQVRDYLYSRSEISTLTANPEFKNNVLVTMGVSFFFPQEVQISR
jgi:outer membrane beta-barrel protein